MTISVALPTCNGARHLAETLRSVLAQGGDFPIVISDDRSDDDTLEIVRREAPDRARITSNPERLGLAENWNRCVALCDSSFVAILHQDDLWCPGHLVAHGKAVANDLTLGLIASGSRVIDAEGREVSARVVDRGGLGDRDRTFAPGEAVHAMATHNPLRCSAVTISKRAHADVGGFDPSYRYVVDWDFWLRVAGRFGVAWLGEPTVDVRWHPASETHRFATGTADLDETARLLDRILNSEDARAPRGEAVRRLARAWLNRAHVALKAGDAGLSRRALIHAVRLSPPILGRIAIDPRLAAQMAAVAIAPGWAGRAFARKP